MPWENRRRANARASDRRCACERLESRRLLTADLPNILVATSGDNGVPGVRYHTVTLAGQDLGSWGILEANSDDPARDVAVETNGDWQIFVGTFQPTLVTRHPNETIDIHNGPAGWSLVNATYYGGVAATSRFVFVTDMLTANNALDQRGLIRFDASNGYTYQRFAQDVNFTDCTIGMDGKLYALVEAQRATVVRVYDPQTLRLIRTVALPGENVACATADASGNIYAGTFDGPFYKLDPQGHVLASLPIRVLDIDPAANGDVLTLVEGNGTATVEVFDPQLNVVSSFTPSGGVATFVAWASYQQPTDTIPPPTITGFVFEDANHNGAWDGGEAGLPGVTVYLDANHNGQLDAGEVTTATDYFGNYTFSNVVAGQSYTVRQVLPERQVRTTPLHNGNEVSVTADQGGDGPVFGDIQIDFVPLDFAYALTIGQHYNMPGTFADGDLNGDDFVNFQDLLILAQNYGHVPPLASAAASARHVKPAPHYRRSPSPVLAGVKARLSMIEITHT